MAYEALPPVREDKRLTFPYFPNRFYASVFRLWETASAERIAIALSLPVEQIEKAAQEMGLPKQKHLALWERRGYLTTIRNAWQLLPYEQLLPLLGWTEEKLASVLKEEDFLFVKLGRFKPYCEPVRPEPLNREQMHQLCEIRRIMQADFADCQQGAEPFAFLQESETEKQAVRGTDKGLRMIYSYCGLFGNVLDCDIAESFPRALLARYQQVGINAVWLPAVLYQLLPFPFDPSYSQGWEMRQARLRELIALAAEYGIRVYLYLNEPRCLPLSFFQERQELLGYADRENGSLCSSLTETEQYLRGAVRRLCTDVCGIGGFVTITCSENLTHCKSSRGGQACSRCANIPTETLVSNVIRAIYEESTAIDPAIETVAWTWAWDDFMSRQQVMACIDRLPQGVIVQCNSEAQKEFCIGGVQGRIRDYSISIPGPADYARFVWDYAKSRGHRVCAKVQINVTWECSPIPYLPVFDLIREHMSALREAGVENLMMSWTLGGYPSVNLRVATAALEDPDPECYRAILREEYGEDAQAIERAATLFSQAFREFPFDIHSVYYGPQNAGPSNLLYPEPTGFDATMTGYAYDDLDRWRAIYPRGVYANQWHKLVQGWQAGMEVLKGVSESCDFLRMAKSAEAIFSSVEAQISFVTAREAGDRERMRQLAMQERDCALRMYELMQQDSAIGYEAANHYYFNKGMLMEKVINCEYIHRIFS